MKKSTWARICLILAVLGLIGGFANDSLFNFDDIIPTIAMWVVIILLGGFGLIHWDDPGKKEEKKDEEK